MPLYSPAAASATSSAMVLIQDQLLAADTATFDFTSIPGSYRHLLITLSGRMTGAVADDAVTMQFNADTGNNYIWQYDGYSSSAGSVGGGVTGSTSVRVGELPGASATTGYTGSFDIRIADYAATTLFKSWHSVGHRASTTRFAFNNGGIWVSTSAITRVTITPSSGNFLAGSRATLYALS